MTSPIFTNFNTYFTGKAKRTKYRRPVVDSDSKSTDSMISSSDMQDIMDRLKMQSYRNSTRKNYYSVWKNFNEFYLRLDDKRKTWGQRLILFVGFLIQEKKQSSTIKCHVSAIKAVLWEDGWKLNEETALLTALTRACRLQNDSILHKFPIRWGLLNVLLRSLEDFYGSSPQPYLTKLYRAMLSTTYFGLLRVGEVMASEHIIKAKDVHIGRNKNKLMMILQSSKTHEKNMKPQIIKINSLGGNHITPVVITEGAISDCPFKILKEYLQVRKKYRSIDEQFFVFSDRTPVQPTQFNRLLKNLIKFFIWGRKYTLKSIKTL